MILAGPIARTLPARWLLPERMAARSLRMPMWESGQRLMASASPSAFAVIAAGDRLIARNRRAGIEEGTAMARRMLGIGRALGSGEPRAAAAIEVALRRQALGEEHVVAVELDMPVGHLAHLDFGDRTP